jgi:hypothetical protein
VTDPTGSRTVPALLFSLAGAFACAAVPATDEWVECAFFPVQEDRDLIPHCARRDASGGLVFAPATFEVLAARGEDPAPLTIAGTLYYLNAAGVAVPVLPFDNGADDFVEGLARTLQDGKVGFIDRELNVVVPPRWDFAFPFENGTAVVCDGCTLRPAGDGHREVVGGRWGVIDARGDIVVPVVHTREALDSVRAP